MGPAKLTRERIVDAAIGIVSTEGGSALTMRRLAADLGVQPTAIYWHVTGRDALVTAILDRVAGEARLATNRARTVTARLDRAATHFRRVLLARPHVLEFLGREGRAAELVAVLRDTCLTEFLAAGQSPARAVRNTRAVVFQVVGFVLVEQGVGSGAGLPEARAGTGRSGVPVTPAVAAAMTTFDHDAVFEFGLRALLRECVRPR